MMANEFRGSFWFLARVACSALGFAVGMSGVTAAEAQVSLPNVLSDHMVLQRESPIHIWGLAAPREEVTVLLNGQSQSAAADGLGRWGLYLNPEHAGGPYTLTVQGSTKVTLSDVLIGDVWLASGQSNMEMPLKGFSAVNVVKGGAEAIAGAHLPGVRLLRLPKKSSPFPLTSQPAKWTECTPETAADFSAVAYFFGREIADRERVPIGLIHSTWGGTPAEAWTSLEGLTADSSLMPIFRTRAEQMRGQIDVTALIVLEAHEDDVARSAGKPLPQHPYHPTPESGEPGALYNGMIAPLIDLQIKGVIWYQGESNAGDRRAPIYSHLFHTLITDWRARFGQGDFPFLFVQLSSYNAGPASDWGTLRDAQRRTLDLRNTGMAVSFDVGEPGNIHPADKETVGRRLALAARAISYGEPVEYQGPMFRQAETVREGKAMRVRFDHGADGLVAKGGALQGFEIAGADHKFVAATAEIDGRSVVVRSQGVPSPAYVRYAWQDAPVANLFNKAGLPAPTFTSEVAPLPE